MLFRSVSRRSLDQRRPSASAPRGPRGPSCTAAASASVCSQIGLPLELLPGKSVVEIKQTGFNKGTAVRELMTYAPFSGRRPLFVGDDMTDRDVFAIMPEFRGIAISVGDKVAGVDYCFDQPPDVRRWLEQISRVDALASP